MEIMTNKVEVIKVILYKSFSKPLLLKDDCDPPPNELPKPLPLAWMVIKNTRATETIICKISKIFLIGYIILLSLPSSTW